MIDIHFKKVNNEEKVYNSLLRTIDSISTLTVHIFEVHLWKKICIGSFFIQKYGMLEKLSVRSFVFSILKWKISFLPIRFKTDVI